MKDPLIIIDLNVWKQLRTLQAAKGLSVGRMVNR